MARVNFSARMFTVVLLVLVTSSISWASVSSVRYNGIMLNTLALDTSTINRTLDPTIYGSLGDRVVLLGIEGVAGERNGWVFGGFGCKGQMTASRSDTFRTELDITLGGITLETMLQDKSNTEYMAGIRLGGGKYSLKFTRVAAEQLVTDLQSASTNPTATSVESPLWFIEPSIGMRSRFNEFIVLEGRLGYGISMSNGEWRFKSEVIDLANLKLGGPSLNVGIKLGAF